MLRLARPTLKNFAQSRFGLRHYLFKNNLNHFFPQIRPSFRAFHPSPFLFSEEPDISNTIPTTEEQLERQQEFTEPAAEPNEAQENSDQNKPLAELVKLRANQPLTLLIDASPILFSSSSALDILIAPDGVTHTHALFGFTKRVLKLISTYQPDYAAVCMDSSTSFRKKMDPTYKQRRGPMPPELQKQFELAVDACQAIGVPCVTAAGFEADDLIATLATKAEEVGHQVRVVTPDKDIHQIVTDNIVVVNHKSASRTQVWDVTTVRERWSVKPELIPQVQAICGDPVDNIVGVPGIGPKGAIALTAKYGSVENLIAQKETIEHSKKEAILSHANRIEKNVVLTTLVKTVDGLPEIQQLKPFRPDQDFTQTFCHTWGLTSVWQHLIQTKAFSDSTEPESEDQSFPEIELRQDMNPDDIRELIHRNMPGITVVNDLESAENAIEVLYQHRDAYHACDTEVIEIDLKSQGPVGNGKIICATIYVGPNADFGNGPRLWIDNLDNPSLQYFKSYFEDPSILKVWHNYGFDRHVMYNHGINALGFGGDTMHMARLWDSSRKGANSYSLESLSKQLTGKKKKLGMMERFGVHPLKVNGEAKKEIKLPPLDDIQRSGATILEWIEYATLDADATWHLRELLHRRLYAMPWEEGVSTMWDFYQQLWLPFGELLTDMERDGIKIDQAHLKPCLPRAEADKKEHEAKFIAWAEKMSPGCKYMNPTSDTQKQQLLFAPTYNKLLKKELPQERVFKVPNTTGYIPPGGKKAPSQMPMAITGLGLKYSETSISGWPCVTAAELSRLAGKPPKSFGSAKQELDERGMDGEEACYAIDAVMKANAIDTLITGFIQPLPLLVDSNDRVHCSLNLNTETGRLSARKPNLQNQPALDKDIYKIRKAFTCEEGNSLIVADYGQLELRLLAHVSNCQSMISAFKSGGDFHSRTAIGMYPHIQQAVNEGKVLLEWNSSSGEAPAPLIKDVFGNERRRAKTLNFSIAYGKTVHGFAKDWNVTKEEAQQTLDKWYADRPEVRSWQEAMIQYAKQTGFTRTLLGRYRPVPGIRSHDRMIAKHSERVVINTPLQGGAADIMVSAMLKLRNSEKLRDLNWKQILQIHDELIFEGPKESAEEALAIVVEIMENPVDQPLLIDLVVDANIAQNWYDAK